MDKIVKTIDHFIQTMGYHENEHVLGIFFYGSYLTGYYNQDSDIDLHIIFDNSDPDHLIRGNKSIDGKRIEYFEKPLQDLYLSVENDYQNQNNALLSIIGTSKIIFDKTGDLKKLQEYVLQKFSSPLPPLEIEDARECISILNNRMEKLKKACEENSPYFDHLYHLTLEKIRKFYHKANGLPEIQTSKVFRVYTDEDYRKSFGKEIIPDPEFVSLYLDAVTNQERNKVKKLEQVRSLFEYAKGNITLEEEGYRILIKSRNFKFPNH